MSSSLETLGWFGRHCGKPCQTGDFKLSSELAEIGQIMALEAVLSDDVPFIHAIYPYEHVRPLDDSAVKVQQAR